jgi:hypothetical protein
VEPKTQSWLEEFIHEKHGVAGTVHFLESGILRLAAAVNIPNAVQQVVATVPRGKGMAGLALDRGVPIQTCNIQTDRSGDVQPGARAVNAQAAVALPIRDSAGKVQAVVGIAFGEERELSSEEVAILAGAASTLPCP